MKKFFLLLALPALLATGCSKGDDDSDNDNTGGDDDGSEQVVVSSVTLDQTSLLLIVGEEATLNATVAPDEVANKKGTWSSSVSSIASVQQVIGIPYNACKVTAIAQGDTEITLTVGGKSATCAVTVEPISIVDSGTVGQLTWTVYNNGDLTIDGNGAMPDYVMIDEMSGGDTPWANYRLDIKKVVVGEGITSVGACAFADCFFLTDVTLPAGLTTVGDYAFSYCTSLKEVSLPIGLTGIGAWAFCESPALTNIALPDTLQSLGEYAFYDCISLTDITLPDSLIAIQNGILGNCTALTTVRLPAGITEIGEWAFYGCIYLKNIPLPEGLTRIEDSAFYGCNQVDITLPSTIQWLGIGVFTVNVLTCLATTPPAISANTFFTDSKVLYVPASSVSLYQATPYWGNCFDTITAIPE